MGGATLSKSNFLFMGRAVFPPCHLKTMVEIWKIMVTIRRPCAGTAALSALDPAAAHCQPRPPPGTHGQVWVSLLWGHCSFLLGPGAHKVLFVPCKTLFLQSYVNSIIRSHWPPKSNSLGFSVSLPDPQVGKSVWVLELSQQC